MIKVILISVLFILVTATVVFAGDKKSYLKYPADERVLVPFSMWNPLLHFDEKGELKSKSYFKYPNSKVLPQGSLWNPLITIPMKGRSTYGRREK